MGRLAALISWGVVKANNQICSKSKAITLAFKSKLLPHEL